MVSVDQLKSLEHTPSTIDKLDQPVCYRTHFFTSLNYFLSDFDLSPVLDGSRFIDTDTLECGNFGIVDASEITKLANILASLNLQEIRKAVEDADFEALVEEEECYELELFSESEIPDALISDFSMLIDFYKQVAESGQAIVSFTTWEKMPVKNQD